MKLLDLENKLLKDDVTNKNPLTQYDNTIRNSVKTLMLVLLALLHKRQGSNHPKRNITIKMIPS